MTPDLPREGGREMGPGSLPVGGRGPMPSVEVHVTALEVLAAAASARSTEGAVEPIRGLLEGLPADELVRVCMALAIETAHVLTPAVERRRLLDRVTWARLERLWVWSS